MKVQMTINHFLDRAAAVYPNRPAIIDEPDQPAPPMPAITYAEMADRRRQMGVAMDKMGIPFGGRVAMVSHNSGRLLQSFFGVSGQVGFDWIFDYIFQPLQATMFSLLAFYVASAAFRAVPSKTLTASAGGVVKSSPWSRM